MGIKNYSLSKEDSGILKGIAICGMLCWHLFYCDNPVGRQFSEFTRFIGMAGDVCVSIFLFVSGYGMSYTLHKVDKTGKGNYFKEVLLRFVKFYFSYWPVLFIMLAIGVFIFHIPLVKEDAGVFQSLKAFLLDFFGLRGQQSYNATWWYNSLILPLYILSPFLYLCIRRMPIITLVLSLLSTKIQFILGCDMGRYLFIYVVGMVWALNVDFINSMINKINGKIFILISPLLLAIFAFSLLLFGDPICERGLPAYAAITILLALSCKTTIKSNYLRKFLSFLGKHSANIYFCHTLIFFYWFPEFFYSINYPIGIFTSLIKYGIPPIWSSCPCVINNPFILSSFCFKNV